MEHFAFQPLLRHALGRKAEQVASAALNEWRFVDAHLAVYKGATKKNAAEPPGTGEHRFNIDDSTTLTPRGFGGVYPYESDVTGTSDAKIFFSKYKGGSDCELRDLLPRRGRSRLVRHYF